MEGQNGIIIPVKNSKALSSMMQKIQEDRELYQKLSANAGRMVQSRYEQSVVWEAVLGEYKGLGVG